MKTDGDYVANTYARFPVQLSHGHGATLFDEAGGKYIDMGAGIAVNTFGAADDEWLAAITAQASKLQHTSNLYYSEPCAILAEMLCEKTGMSKVFFGNSGAEANECAIKVARRYSFLKYGESRKTIITLKNSFHGRTVTTLAATGQDSFHTEFGPLTEGFVYADAHDVSDIVKFAESGTCCAVMIELVQGEGGVNVLEQDFVHEVARICGEHDMLLIIDEVQTGNGRSGSLYAYMSYGITPDIVTTAKGLAGGLPLGAAMLGEKVRDVLTPGSHGSTFGGNPVCCAGAISILSRLDDKLLASVREKSAYIKSQLDGAKGVKSITGMGLMLGIESERPTKEVIAACIGRGVLILSAKNKIRLLPPLNINDTELEYAVNIIKEECAK